MFCKLKLSDRDFTLSKLKAKDPVEGSVDHYIQEGKRSKQETDNIADISDLVDKKTHEMTTSSSTTPKRTPT